MFTHYLVTRFNMQEPTWRTTDKQGETVCTDEWMNDRFQLFAHYCLPSVAAQTCQNFKWIVLFHHNTAPRWREVVKAYAETYGFVALYVGRMWLQELQAYLSGMARSGWLITTRLDNDDLIAPGYLALVQAAFQRQRFVFVDVPSGYRLQDGKLFSHFEPYNPFMSLIERASRLTVLHVPHGRVIGQKYNSITFVSKQWIQVIHQRNYSNDGTRGPIVDTPQWAKRYL